MSRMSVALARTATRLADPAVAGESVTYTRGHTAITITAVPGKRQPRQDDVGDQARIKLDREPMDFLIRPSAIVFGGAVVEPEKGHRITYGGRVYEVSPQDGEPCFRLSDPGGNLLRIHTVRVA